MILRQVTTKPRPTSVLSRQVQTKCTCLPAASLPGAAAPAMVASAAAVPGAEEKVLAPDPCIVQETCSLCALRVLMCFRSKALCAKQGQSTDLAEEQARGCLLHLLSHATAPAPGLVCLLLAPGSWLPLDPLPEWWAGLGQMLWSLAQPSHHLRWRVPSRLQQQIDPEVQSGPMRYIDREDLLLTEVPASRGCDGVCVTWSTLHRGRTES